MKTITSSDFHRIVVHLRQKSAVLKKLRELEVNEAIEITEVKPATVRHYTWQLGLTESKKFTTKLLNHGTDGIAVLRLS